MIIGIFFPLRNCLIYNPLRLFVFFELRQVLTELRQVITDFRL